MTIDERVRDALHAYADPIEPTPGSWERIEARLDDRLPRERRPRGPLVVAAIGILVIVALIGAAVIRDSDDSSNVVIDKSAPTAPERIVALTSKLNLVVVDPKTGEVIRTLARQVSVSRWTSGIAPAPDGKSVYFASELPTHPRPACPGQFDMVMRVHISGGRAQVVQPGRAVAVSPDGQWLAATRDRLSSCGPEQPVIDLRNLATGELRSIPGTTGVLSGLSWAPDSRHLAFTWYKDSSYTNVLDTQTATALEDAREVQPDVDVSGPYSTYLGTTGDFVAPVGHNRVDSRVVALSSGGRGLRVLYRSPQNVTNLSSDATGAAVLMVTGRAKQVLYRWHAGDRAPTKVASGIVDAAWIPDPRSTTSAGSLPNGIAAIRGDELVVLGATDLDQHSSLGAAAGATAIAPTADGRTWIVGATGPPARCDFSAPRTPPVLRRLDTEAGQRTDLVGAAYSPAVSPAGVVAYGYTCDGNGLGLTDLRTGENYRTDPLPKVGGRASEVIRSVRPLGWSSDGRSLLYVVQGPDNVRAFVVRFAPAFFHGARNRDRTITELRTGDVRAATMAGNSVVVALQSDPTVLIEFRGRELTESRRLVALPVSAASISADSSGDLLIVTPGKELWRWSRGESGPVLVAPDVSAAAWIPWS